MKYNWKRLAALLVAIILMLSLTGLGEEEIVIDRQPPAIRAAVMLIMLPLCAQNNFNNT